MKCLKSFSWSFDHLTYDLISSCIESNVKLILKVNAKVESRIRKYCATHDLCRNRKTRFPREMTFLILLQDVLPYVCTPQSHESSLFAYNLSRASHLSFLWEKILCVTFVWRNLRWQEAVTRRQLDFSFHTNVCYIFRLSPLARRANLFRDEMWGALKVRDKNFSERQRSRVAFRSSRGRSENAS